jgi:hypothetical protein
MALTILLIISLLAIGCGPGVTPPPPQPSPPATTILPPPGAEPSSLLPTSNNTYDVGSNAKRWRDLFVGRNTIFTNNVTGGTFLSSTLTSPTITSPTITGTGTVVLTTANITTISQNAGTLNIGSPTITTPTVSGTPVFSNHQSGTVSFTAGSINATVTHGMSGTPTRIFLTVKDGVLGIAGDATAANSIYWSSANSTAFWVNSSVATNTTRSIDWLAFIADE